MSVAAVMLVKDEADIIERNVRHLLTQVDVVYVADNLSTDGTSHILVTLRDENPGRVHVRSDDEVAYRQDEKTTALAHEAHLDGHSWVLPVDADELWYSPFGRIGDILEHVLPQSAPDALFVTAKILNHVATGDDPPVPDPLERLGWRLREVGELPKVACRTGVRLRIGMGNHEAWNVGRVSSNARDNVVADQLYIHHFPWRSALQFERKIANGALAYAAAPDVGEQYGVHWKQFGLPTDEGFATRVHDWFWQWGYREDPAAAGDLVYDPWLGGPS